MQLFSKCRGFGHGCPSVSTATLHTVSCSSVVGLAVCSQPALVPGKHSSQTVRCSRVVHTICVQSVTGLPCQSRSGGDHCFRRELHVFSTVSVASWLRPVTTGSRSPTTSRPGAPGHTGDRPEPAREVVLKRLWHQDKRLPFSGRMVARPESKRELQDMCVCVLKLSGRYCCLS